MLQYFSGEPAYVNLTVRSREPACVNGTVLQWRTSIRQYYSTLEENQHTSLLQYFSREPAYVNVTVL
jgi:hypothetical protein